MAASAEVRVPCGGVFDETLAFFCDRLGFRVERIHPADRPRLAVVTGSGVRLRLDANAEGAPPEIVIRATESPALTAPNGSRIEFEPIEVPLTVPALEPDRIVTNGDDTGWTTGRAGMGYRDLLPGRLGGRFIASHIRIDAGGPVPDYVHYHRVRFQMIFVRRGWVRVVYEDQGEPFVMHAGDCVLQPPTVRHRVLESSPGLEVIEIGCPAEHETLADAALELPTDTVDPARDFGGQRFLRHQADIALWVDSGLAGMEIRPFGLGAATDGLAEGLHLRAVEQRLLSIDPPDELLFVYVLAGKATVDTRELARDGCCVLPPNATAELGLDAGCELLVVTLPAAMPDAYMTVTG
ncbi:MAG: cupin domain-containing protein [Pseudomonadota bacterium]